MECKKKENAASCSCSYDPCPRKGVCCECVAYHRENGEIPGCFFTKTGEKTYDRSIENFIRDAKNSELYGII
ncbi:MAG: DUF6485 family protein [Elusimicrobiota bacterium]